MSLINVGYDASGNGNNWTVNNIDNDTTSTSTDVMVDSPTRYGTDTGAGGEVRGNYATFNPLDKGSSVTLDNGNLVATLPEQPVSSTIGASSGKYYVETTIDTQGSVLIGWVNASYYPSQGQPWDYGDNALYYSANGQKVINNSFTPYASSATSGDVIGVAVDFDSNSIEFFKNGSSLGSFSKTFSGNYKFVVADATSATNTVITLNAGQRPFAYTPPAGFLSLCTTNLPTPTILNGGDYFNAVLYTGNGTSQSITNVDFAPDFTWIKDRTLAWNNKLFDTIRGAGKYLISDSTAAEATDTNQLSAFLSNGFSVGSQVSVNGSGDAYVAWNWKANGSGVSNTDGTITSSISVNTTSGFSIVTYTGTGSAGATVGHGLNAKPDVIIAKNRDQADGWRSYHDTGSSEILLFLHSTSAQGSSVSFTDNWTNTSPTSSVFSIGTDAGVNSNAEDYIAYVFHSVEGYSAFGSYTGNGSADGPFVYTGFRVAYVMIKGSSFLSNWRIADSARNTYNVASANLEANLTDAEGATANTVDFLSNGFKIRGTGGDLNTSSGTIIYMAFAQNPFKYSNAR